MKYFLITALIFCFSTGAWAGHSRGNGTCLDDVIHWQNMIDKRSDAPGTESGDTVTGHGQEGHRQDGGVRDPDGGSTQDDP